MSLSATVKNHPRSKSPYYGSSKNQRKRWKASCLIPTFLCLAIIINAVMVILWFRTGAHAGPSTTDSHSSITSKEAWQQQMLHAVSKELNNPISSSSSSSKSPTAVVAHAVSLIKCNKQSSVEGFLDAAAVLRHSIHKQSIHTPESKSEYSYQMYAIVHTSCQENAKILQRLGYKTLVRESPVSLDEISPGWYKDHVEAENCCGSAEFIKLYAYELEEHPIVVHWDMDIAVLKPMDDLFNAMMFDKDSAKGQQARQNLEVQHPNEPLPDVIDAYFTRDITSAQPWEKVQGVQGGFLVSRPSKTDLETYKRFIKEGNYKKGRCDTCGWGELGYGGFQGAMAYQGVVAYFYDQFKPNTAVELNVCRWNQVVADVIWRGPRKMEHHMQCREYPKDGNFEANTQCEDCRVTPIEQVNTVHYTACKKPWECLVPHPRVPRNKREVYRLENLTNITTCGKLFRKWFELRHEFEDQVEALTGLAPAPRSGSFEPHSFMGSCNGRSRYESMKMLPDDFDVGKLYGM